MPFLLKLAATAALTLAAMAAQAKLIHYDDGTVQDTSTGLFWLHDWGGARSWQDSLDWAANLDFAGSQDWRLPRLDEYLALLRAPEIGDFPQGAYYGLASQFDGIDLVHYWTSTESPFCQVVDVTDCAVSLRLPASPYYMPKYLEFSATAVRAPEPPVLALAGSALAGLWLATRVGRSVDSHRRDR